MLVEVSARSLDEIRFNGKEPMPSSSSAISSRSIRRRPREAEATRSPRNPMTLKGEQVEVFPDLKALTLAAARRLSLLANNAVQDHGVFTVALSGGSTPRMLYHLLATDETIRSNIPWPNVHFFFGDERHVPPAHAESNFRMANEAMFQQLRAEDLHVHRILAELSSASE